MGTLFECLREARLEKYYPTLRVNGITKSESLAKLTLEDCEAIGVTSTEDKRRLIELINIIKSVHQSDSPNVTPPRMNVGARPSSARKRNRSPAYTAQSQTPGYALTATNNVRVRENQPTAQAHSGNQFLSRAEIFDLVSSSDESSSEGSAHSDYEPAKKHLNAASVSPPPPRIRKTAVSRVRQSGYNYGVPKAGSIAQSVSKTKARGAEGGLLGDERIRVCVRKRPMNKREIKNKEEDICKAESTTTLTVNEPKQAVDLTAYTLEHEFIFDEVFDEKCSNEDVYVRAARPLVSNIFTGGSATCFAYGQTGAGKTHTMIGSRDVPGLYLLATHDIFSIIESKQYGSDLKVWVSFFEIYCGQLFDLLNKRNRLHAREDGSHHVCIAGLTETQVQNVAAIMQVLEYGNSVRSKGVTGVNPDSSRSHAVLQLEIRNGQDKRVGRMSFIDLAGSERASDMTETDRQTRMEGAEINQSLLALKECIRSIDQDSKHTPFRQSKLTHILKDSFVGNSRTCMIANFSPTHISCEHTLNTLRYADRVKELRRDPGAGGTRASLASNILMNIPLQAPSVFQPSNVLCSSTPMRHRSSRQSSSRVVSDIALDPNETPIKGHGMRRKIVPKNIAKSESTKPSRSVASRLSVVRHTGPSKSSSPVTSRRNLAAEAACQDSSTDDTPEHTESDSNNITIPNRQRAGVGASNVPITHSQDTDNDFPTTDFNNEEMLNDLNKTGGKQSGTGQTMPMGEGSTSTASGAVHLSTAGHPLPMIEQSKASHGASSCSNNHAIPMLRNKKYTDSPRVTIASVPTTGMDQPSPSSRNIQGSGSAGAVASGPKVSDTLPQRHSRPSSEFNDSFEDDLLFDGTNRVPDSARGYPRKPSTGESNLQNSGGDNNSPNLGLSRGRDAPFKVPQDTLTTPAIPAVLTAISSDLTTFSQRSPGRIGNNRFHKPEPPQGLPSSNRPPFTVEKTNDNPMVSRPRILRTPPPVVSESLMESPEYQGRSKVPAPFSVPHQPNRNLNDNRANTNRLSPHNVYRQTNARENRRDNIDEEVELSSTGEWYATPANFDTHIGTSVQRSSNFVSQSSKLQPGAFFSKYKEFTNNITPEKPYEDYHDEDETEIKGVDGDMSEFLTVQRRQTTPENRKTDTASRQNVASRLRSVFFKPPSENSELHGPSTSKPSETKSVTSDSGLAGSVTDSPQAVRTCWDSSTKPVLNIPPSQSTTIPTLLQESSHDLPENDKIPALLDPSNKENILATKYHQDGTVSFSSSSSHDSRSENSAASGGRSANNTSAIKTEKLTVGSAFSPIHPQPVTSSNRLTKSVAVGIVSKDILQPKALAMSTDNAGNGRRRTISEESIPSDPRQRLIAAHEDQLAVVTSLCKLEMKLLLGAKAGTKTYEEYVDKIGNILSQKMAAMQLLQEHIKSYTAFQVHRGADSS